MEDACILETGFGALLTPEEEGKKNELVVKLSKINIKKQKNRDEITSKAKDEGKETPSIKEDFNRENEDWSPDAIFSLLDACNYYEKNSMESSKLDMAYMWKEISKDVSGRCKSSKRPKDVEQCKSKLKSMQGKYNREKMAKKFNPNESSSWEWYNTMDLLINRNPQLIANSMEVKHTKQGLSQYNEVLSSTISSDLRAKCIEKSLIEQNTSKKPLVLDVSENLCNICNEESFDSKSNEDEKTLQYSNLSTPTTPKSPKTYMKVKWNDSTPSQFSITNNSSIAKPLDSLEEKKGFQLVNEIRRRSLDCKEETSNTLSLIDSKDKGTLKFFDSYSDNSTNCFGSDMTNQNSTTSSPIVQKSSQNEHLSSKHEKIGSTNKDGEEQNVSRFSVMESSRSINCNYKHTSVEKITNIKRGSKNEEVLQDGVSNIDDSKSHTIPKAQAQDQSLAISIVRNDEQLAASLANVEIEAHSSKIFSKGSSLASLTSQNESSVSSKQKRRLRVLSNCKYERGHKSSRTLMMALMRSTHNMPNLKKRMRPLARVSLEHEPNMVSALMTFGSMIQQLEKNHIVLMERILNEQSNILKDFVKTLKYNHQVREATMVGLVVRFLLSIFLIGVILFGTSKTTSSWMPLGFQSSSWYGKNIDDNFSQLAWVGCFIIVLFTQLLWTSFKTRPITPLNS